MADLIGAEHIDWDTFEVTNPEAPEYQAPAPEPDTADDSGAPANDADTGPQGRPHDPVTGRFVKQDEAPEEQQQEEAPRLYAGKYQTVEELEKAVAHQESLMGRQSNEVAELRRQMQEMTEAFNRPRVTYDLDQTFAEDPAAAADQAIMAQDAQAYQRVMREWMEVDPAQARMYQNMKALEVRLQEEQQRTQQWQQQTQSAAIERQLGQAWEQVEREFPSINTPEFRQAMQEEAAEAMQAAGQAFYSPLIESGDPQQAYYALRTLARAASMRLPATHLEQAQQLAQQAARAAQRAKADAIVTSATATAPEQPTTPSYDDELLEQFQDEDKSRDGWQIGSY